MLNDYLSVRRGSSARLEAMPTSVDKSWWRKVSGDKALHRLSSAPSSFYELQDHYLMFNLTANS